MGSLLYFLTLGAPLTRFATMLFPQPVGSTARTSRFSINSCRKHCLCSSFNFGISRNKLRAFSSDDSKSVITERFAIVSSHTYNLKEASLSRGKLKNSTHQIMRILQERAGTTWCWSPVHQVTCLAVMASSCAVCKQCFGARNSTVPCYKEMKPKELVITAEPVKIANLLEEIGISIEHATRYVCKKCALKIASCHQLYVEIASSLSLTRDIEAYPSLQGLKRKGAPPTHQQV